MYKNLFKKKIIVLPLVLLLSWLSINIVVWIDELLVSVGFFLTKSKLLLSDARSENKL